MTMPNWASLDAEQQRQLQLRKLRQFLSQQIVPYHPFYRDMFARENIDVASIQSLADMKCIPFSSKGDVAPTAEDPDRPRQFILQPTPELLKENLPVGRKLRLLWKKLTQGVDAVRSEIGLEYRPVQAFFTTGRTALPTSFLMSNYDLGILDEVGRRIGQVVQVDPAVDRVVSLFPYAPHLAFWQVQSVGTATGTFTLQTGGGKVMGTEGILRAIGKMRPSVLCGIPGYVYHTLRQAVEEGVDLSSVRTVFLGGDRIAEGFRNKLIEVLERGGARAPIVLSVFGFTESRRCWAECPGGEETGLHTYPDLDLFEVIDPDSGEILPDGETGELVYTPLDGRGTIVLRYRTGDIANGGITRVPCPACGRSVPRLSSNLSRSSNMTDFNLTKVKGTLVNLNAIADILNSHAVVDEWQLVIAKKNDDPFDVDELRLVLALVPGKDGEPARAIEDVENKLLKGVELRPSATEILPREEILERIGMETRLKENRIVDLREQSSAPSAAAAGSTAAGEG
ncbi:MAG: AMP-binding protein [Planctomycetota bacterium]